MDPVKILCNVDVRMTETTRKNYIGWDNWGLEIIDNKIDIFSGHDCHDTVQLTLNV